MPDYKEGENLEEKTRDNALFLSVADQFNGKIAAGIMNWFRQVDIVSGVNHIFSGGITFEFLKECPEKIALINYFREIDLGFDDAKTVQGKIESSDFTRQFPSEFPIEFTNTFLMQLDMMGQDRPRIRTSHKVFDNNKKFIKNIEFDATSQESSGTNKMLDLAGMIFLNIWTGGIVIIDELDAKLHPLLTLSIIKLFQNPKLNKNGAQLIFATHDTNILSRADLRRDQIYFVEKDNFGASDLYSLVEYDEVKLGNDLEEDYMRGRYGAIPYFNTNLTETSNKTSETIKKNGKEGKN